ncbi:MAG: hypothetical protein J6K04_07455 [Lachnospiraceae bacterium]|nr:hypothetical protein [Lachnospiraceae bacterium]
MRKRIGNTLWGLLFIALGIGIVGDMMGAWELNLLFAGWWTMFLIIPAFLSIISNGIRIGNSIGLVVGLALLACVRGYLPWEVLAKMLVPVVMILIGGVMVFRNLFHLNLGRVKVPNEKRLEELVVFSGKNLVIQDTFYGIDGEAIFGGLTIDLRGAKIEENISIDAMAVFGGVDILLPANVSVKLSDLSLFGGCSNARENQPYGGPVGPTVYVNATALFGGVEVK